jgi:hypothetical protein
MGGVRLELVVSIVVALLVPGRALATDTSGRCPVPGWVAPEVEQIDPQRRLTFIRDRLRSSARRSNIWAWSWAGGFAALATGNLILSQTLKDPRDPNKPIPYYFALGGSGTGMLVSLIARPRVIRDSKWLEGRVTQASPDDTCRVLAQAEALLWRDAENQLFGRSWLSHIGSFLFSVGLGIGLGFGFDKWGQAFLQTTVGVFIGQTRLVTQPVDTVWARQSYRRGDLEAPDRYRWSLVPLVASTGRGTAAPLLAVRLEY